jgi:hypothetical protein
MEQRRQSGSVYDRVGIGLVPVKERWHANVAAALAAKHARIAWAMLAKGTECRVVGTEEAVA